MESTSFNKEIVQSTLDQILQAIEQIELWNENIDSYHQYGSSPEGMKTLAATSMLIEAIGEGVKKIDHKTEGKFLLRCPEIPWREIMNMRNHIAHGYFDIDSELIFDVVKNDLKPLGEAINSLISFLRG